MSQIRLLPDRRFAPLFWTQFLGAFNDNFFKSALVLLITYKSVSLFGMQDKMLVALAQGLFILPFVLVSATAGQLCDRYPKSQLIRYIKLAEIFVMAFAVYGFYTENIGLLVGVLFFMGMQSTFFGPAKYSILPELLEEHELTGGNALVETGTFLSILLGTIAGGLSYAFADGGGVVLSLAVIAIAILGFFASLFIPQTAPAAPTLRVEYNVVTPTWRIFKSIKSQRSVLLSVLGISWFWFFGASFLTLLPPYTKDILFGDPTVTTFLLALFCVGIAVGSILCERLGGEHLEIGLVPFGSIGMTLATLDLFFAGAPQTFPPGDELWHFGALLDSPAHWRIFFDFFLIAAFGGLYSVPLYTMIQQRTERHERSRIIAANNILNAFFMVVSAGIIMLASAQGFDSVHMFLGLALLNALVALYIYSVVPEFFLRFVAFIIGHFMYRIRVVGSKNIPQEGPAILVANHVSFIDWLLILTASPRPLRFVMHYSFLSMPFFKFLCRQAKVIPIASAAENENVLNPAYEATHQALQNDEMICIFPEGKITATGELNAFRPGIEKIVARDAVPVIPVALKGMWGSFFSRKYGKAMRKPFQRVRSKVHLKIGEPVIDQAVTAQILQQKVEILLNETEE